MTYRERMERRAEQRREWAEKRAAKSESALNQGRTMLDAIPLGQPILVGHHSEKRDRRYRERAVNKIGQGFEHGKMAEHHESRADGIEHQLDRSIFDDDPDAIERLEERIAELEAKRERMKQANADYRAGLTKEQRAEFKAMTQWQREEHLPYPAYSFTNLGGNIRRLKQRIPVIQRQRERAAAAEESETGITITGTDWINVTFADKPARSVLDALKAAGFRYSKGTWMGYRSRLPEGIA